MLNRSAPHLFHIPVMGTGFTIDSPLKVARYGISSVISLVDDTLIEQMRCFHCRHAGEPYEEIPTSADDSRARRITAYLNLLQHLVEDQVRALQSSPFEPGSELTRYYDLLPEGPRKQAYREMLRMTDPLQRRALQERLRQWATPGSIDVNIMTKLDREVYKAGRKLESEQSEALAALRGFALSELQSAIIFSAGMNARLYTYASQFADFLPDAAGTLRKKIILKISDFRSAAVQGRFLAKRGLWVSEYRVESGLNCGGHVFATEGYLLGPILQELHDKRETLTRELLALCNASLAARGKPLFPSQPECRITVQGGIGTPAEQNLLFHYYGVDGTGWGTPFLLVPEVTNVDPVHREKLAAAVEDDVVLSDHSPLGVPFWILKDSASEQARIARINQGKPGSPCPKGHLAANTEFTDVPICTASRAYQRLKLKELEASNLDAEDREAARSGILRKTCICHDLAGGATLSHGIDPAAFTAVCCGPNIVNFNRIVTLSEMIDHIYGRCSLLSNGRRPHMFIRELMLYVDHFRQVCAKTAEEHSARSQEYLRQFKENLLAGIAHYRRMADQIIEGRIQFLEDLDRLNAMIDAFSVQLQPVS